MAVDAGSINSEVRLLLKELRNDVVKVEKTLNGLAEKAKQNNDKTTSGFQKLKKILVGIGALKVGRILISGFKELISLASEAQETNGKFGTTFKAVKKEAEDATKDLIKNYGLSSQASKKLLSDTGDLLSGFGFTGKAALNLSSEVNKLAVDLASFTNFAGGAEGASAALTKALLGEREGVKSLGIAILESDVQAEIFRQTQQGIVFESERQAKAYATLAIAQRQSKNAIGDFARTQDSFANQTRVLRARVEDLAIGFGSKLLPAATTVVSALNKLFTTSTNTKDLTEELISLEAKREEILSKLKGTTSELADEEERRNKALLVTINAKIADRVKRINKEYRAQKEELRDLNKELAANNAELNSLAIKQEAAFITERSREKISNRLLDLQSKNRNIEAERAELQDKIKASEEFVSDALSKNLLSKEAELGLDQQLAVSARNRLAFAVLTNQELQKRKEIDDGGKEEAIKEKITLTKEQLELQNQLLSKSKEFDATDKELALLQVEREREKALAIAEGNEQLITQVDAYYDKLRDVTAYEENKRLEEDLTKKKEEEWAKREKIADLALGGINSILVESFELQAETSAKGSKRELEARRKAFHAAKIQQVGELTISGIKSAQQAFNLASSTIPPPAGPIVGGVLAGIIATGTAIGVGKIIAKKPGFQYGGIVPGARHSGPDSVDAKLKPREMVLTDEQQAKLFNIASGSDEAGPITMITQFVSQTGEVLREWIYEGTKNGQQKIHANGLIALQERI